MISVPDPPYIRYAEMYGADDGPVIECPICEEEPEYLYKDANGEIVGCNKCVKTVEPEDWYRDELERSRPE